MTQFAAMSRILPRRIRRAGMVLFFLALIVLPGSGSAQQGTSPVITAPTPAESTAMKGGEQAKPAEGEKGGEHGSVIPHILEHKVADTPFIDEYPFPRLWLPKFEPIRIGSLSIDLSITRHLVYLWIAALITFLMVRSAARQNSRRRVPRGFGNMIESVVVFIRDEVAAPVLGHEAKKYLPILLTFFFFISTANLLGLFPFGATATGNINVTAALALTSFGMMLAGGMGHNGVFGYFRGLVPAGLPVVLAPLMFVIEIIGMLTKPFALAVRLFANMLSGGLVIGAFYALIIGLHSFVIAPVSLAFLLFMTLLKIFVCLLQAYIFTMLSAFFLNMAVHQDH